VGVKEELMDTLIWSIFWASVAVFIVMVCTMLVPRIRKLLKPYFIFSVIGVLAILGVILIVLTIQKEVEGTSRIFLLLTVASMVGMSLFAILHNLITIVIKKLFKVRADFDEPVFFIFATVVSPLGFLSGAIGTIVLA
jgi:hypothetical protein